MATNEPLPGTHDFEVDYLGKGAVRLCSYRQQITWTLEAKPRNTLVVGTGDGLVPTVLERAGIDVVSLDIRDALLPTMVGNVDRIPTVDRCFDVSICCQVLEHLPFDRVPVALRELRRVTSNQLIISVPDKRRFISIRSQLFSFLFEKQWSVPRIPTRKIPLSRLDKMGHHWEVGYRDTSYSTFVAEINSAGWKVQDSYRIPDLPWHLFLRCT